MPIRLTNEGLVRILQGTPSYMAEGMPSPRCHLDLDATAA